MNETSLDWEVGGIRSSQASGILAASWRGGKEARQWLPSPAEPLIPSGRILLLYIIEVNPMAA